jgi:tetratricopeptide (TPR) repeat protein
MEAPHAYAAAVALNKQEVQYVNGLGTALHSAQRLPEAVAAYRTALRLAPTWSAPYRNLGLVEHEAGHAALAVRWFALTLRLSPADADTYTDIGTNSLELNDLGRALANYSLAARLQPSNQLARANLVYLRTKLCDWRDRALLGRELRQSTLALLRAVEGRSPNEPAPHLYIPPYHALAYENFDGHTLLRLATAYAQRAALTAGAPLAPLPMAPAARRLVVGYVSTDFGSHPTSHLMRSVWRIQRARGRPRDSTPRLAACLLLTAPLPARQAACGRSASRARRTTARSSATSSRAAAMSSST